MGLTSSDRDSWGSGNSVAGRHPGMQLKYENGHLNSVSNWMRIISFCDRHLATEEAIGRNWHRNISLAYLLRALVLGKKVALDSTAVVWSSTPHSCRRLQTREFCVQILGELREVQSKKFAEELILQERETQGAYQNEISRNSASGYWRVFFEHWISWHHMASRVLCSKVLASFLMLVLLPVSIVGSQNLLTLEAVCALFWVYGCCVGLFHFEIQVVFLTSDSHLGFPLHNKIGPGKKNYI